MVILKSSSGTGKKILSNGSVFKVTLICKENINNDTFIKFGLSSNKQSGTFVIQQDKNGRILESSTLNCADFDRPLGMNNDPSLRQLAENLLTNEGISYTK